MGTTEWDELSRVLAADSTTFLSVRNSYLASRPKLVDIVAARALRLHGGELPASWTREDLRLDAAIALITLINALRVYGTDLTTGWGRLRFTPEQLADRLKDRTSPTIDPRVLRPDRIEAYLIHWAAPAARQALEDAEDDEIGRRRHHRLRRALTELSQQRQSQPTPAEAADWANKRSAESYGIAEATRNPSTAAIARASDLDPQGAEDREATAARIRHAIAATAPTAAADLGVLVKLNRQTVVAQGLHDAAMSGSLVRPTDLIDSADGRAAREAESTAVRKAMLAWLRTHPTGRPHRAAAAYTTAKVTELGHRRLRAAGSHLTAGDLQETHPLLVDPDDLSTATLFGFSDSIDTLDTALLRDEILAGVAARHPLPVLLLASEWLDCTRHGLTVRFTRRTARRFGFADRSAMVAALDEVSAIARMVADSCQGNPSHNDRR